MSAKLKVDELRAQLSLRGLDTSGTKPTLVRRLESALHEEQEASNPNGGKKRQRESIDENLTIASLRGMGVRELRELAACRGVSTNGSKRELVERLSCDEKKDLGELFHEKVVEEIKEEKLVTATKKGGVVLDQWLPDNIKSSYHVLQLGEEIYDAMLNQTNVGENNNKFYVIQALESDDGGTFMVYNRWGRVGVRGQDKLHGPYKIRERAIDEFQMKFFDKTKNQWTDRKDFICYPKLYTWLEMDYSEAGEKPVLNKTDESIGAQLRETKLEPRIAKFISLICNISMMRQQMLEIGYNAEKLPLGKLSKSTILKGYDVLSRISAVITQADRKKLEQLSGEFYTVIPHDFGFKKMRSFVIDTPNKLKCKLEMVAALGEIEIATKILNENEMQKANGVNP